MTTPTKLTSRAYIYELDVLRAYTAFTVVTIHTLSAAAFLIAGPTSVQVYNMLIHLLHYNREVFVTITSLLLMYLYLNRPSFSLKEFYLKRFSLIFIPYVVWSVIYVIKNNHYFVSLGHYSWLLVWNILTGNASPQLYYIILSLQLYAALPLLLWFVRKTKKYPWQTLGASFVLQLMLSYLDYKYIEAGNLRQHYFVNVFLEYHGRFLPMYQLAVVAGLLAGAHITAVQDFLQRRGRWIFSAMLLTTIGFCWYYFYEINHDHYDIGHAITVIQPSVTIYSLVATVFFGWLATVWARRRPAYGAVKLLANISFGIYFVQYLFIDLVFNTIYPHLPKDVPVGIMIPGLVLACYGLSALCCYVIFKIPHLSWTIGRPSTLEERRDFRSRLLQRGQ